jgi:choline kinase
MVPEGESPLLLPANKHKQLVVIDFEYANANLPGLEFANHFVSPFFLPLISLTLYNPFYHRGHGTDSCSRLNGHTTTTTLNFRGVAIPNTTRLWRNSIGSFALTCYTPLHTGHLVGPPRTHRPPHLGPLPTSGSTTALAATAAPNTIGAFMLDSRAPPGEKYSEQEAQRERQTEEEARRLMAETKLWRLANSAMWVAWGIVQAHVPGLPDFEAEEKRANANENAAELESATTEIRAEAEAEAEEEKGKGSVSEEKAEDKDGVNTEGDQDTDIYKSQDEEEFDYLAYAQDRAMFLWGDAIRMGMIQAEELPEDVRQRVRMVEY